MTPITHSTVLLQTEPTFQPPAFPGSSKEQRAGSHCDKLQPDGTKVEAALTMGYFKVLTGFGFFFFLFPYLFPFLTLV